MRTFAASLLGLTLLTLSGCAGSGVETSYGRTRGASLNGTGVAAALFRESGHELRTALRLNEELGEWAEVIVRFAPRPGPLARDEAGWYNRWLTERGNRRLLYIPQDYDAQADYWGEVLAKLPGEANARDKEIAGKERDLAKGWPGLLPPVAKEVADRESWFAVEVPKPNAVMVCKTLGAPWGRGIDAARAALPRHHTLKVDSERVLLTGDDRPLAIEWTLVGDSRVLVLASGAFLVNGALINPARRPLALRVVDWAGEEPRKVAFLEGANVLGEAPSAPSVFKLLRVKPFGWVAAQMLALGLAACLARAVRLGRPRPDLTTGEDRPAAHPEALGILLARTGQPGPARAQLEAYRQWRKKSAPGAGHLPPSDSAFH